MEVAADGREGPREQDECYLVTLQETACLHTVKRAKLAWFSGGSLHICVFLVYVFFFFVCLVIT